MGQYMFKNYKKDSKEWEEWSLTMKYTHQTNEDVWLNWE